MELLVIDRFLYKFFGSIDNFFEWLTTPRCKCKLKGKVKKKVTLEVDKTEVDKTFENEIKK